MALRPHPHLADIEPYALPDTSAPGDGPVLQLAQNENALPPSPLALQAAREACDHSALYPDADASALRQALAGLHAIDAQGVVCARGSMELIALLATAYLAPGTSAVMSEYGYLYFETATRLVGAEVLRAPEAALSVDVDALGAVVREDTRVVWLANPSNPTGDYLPAASLRQLRANLPSRVLLVIDEAYAEYVSADRYDANFDLVEEGNTVVLRTFSKAYGLAGLRVGWGYFPRGVVDVMRALLQPNALTGPSQAAAVAAVDDVAHVQNVRALTAASASEFTARMQACGLDPRPTHGNFVLLRFASGADADALQAHLLAAGILVRPMGSYGLPDCLRVTLGTAEQMRRVSASISEGCDLL